MLGDGGLGLRDDVIVLGSQVVAVLLRHLGLPSDQRRISSGVLVLVRAASLLVSPFPLGPPGHSDSGFLPVRLRHAAVGHVVFDFLI